MMGLLTSFGKHVKGLLGDDAFADRLAQAQAFANGDPATAARIGAERRKRNRGLPMQPPYPDPFEASRRPPRSGPDFNPHRPFGRRRTIWDSHG